MLRACQAAASRAPRILLAAASCVLATAAGAQATRLCGAAVEPGVDARLLTHFPYRTTPRAELARPPGALHGQCEAVHRDLRDDLAALLARAHADREVGPAIVALSCFRSPAHQARLFCRAGRATAPLLQAYQVAPPGHSEHATGLAIDFGDRRRGCNLTACFAATPVGRWLAKNAADFGFEMSFPRDNPQGVAFEPWHWRWVGREGSDRSARARTIFAAARERFPVAEPAALARVDLGDTQAFTLPATARPAALLAEFTWTSPRPVQAGQ